MNSKMLVIKAKSEPMKGIVKPLPNQIYKHPNLVIQNREKKKLGSNDIRLQMLYVGICGSDLHLAKENSETGYIISSAPAFIPEEGRVIGHEGVGKVLDVGENVKNIHKDMIVTLESILVCNQCVQCKQGKFNQCKNSKLIGLEIDGIMGEVVDVNSSLAHDITPYVKEEKDLKAMTCIEPAGVAFDACVAADIKPGDRILIFGGGPIGALAAMLCKRVFGASMVSLVEPIDFRRNVVKKIVNNIYKDVNEIYAEIQDVDVVIETSGVLENVNTIFPKISANGRVVLLARNGKKLVVDDVDHMITNNIKIVGSRGHLEGAFNKILRLYESGDITLDEIITTEINGINKAKELLETENFEHKNCKVIVKIS